MEEKKNNKPLFVKMMVLYLLLVLGIGGAMLASTIKTQVIDGEMWREKAKAREELTRIEPARRGTIFSSDGKVLATTVPVCDLCLDLGRWPRKNSRGEQVYEDKDNKKPKMDSFVTLDTSFDEHLLLVSELLHVQYPNKSAEYFKRMIEDEVDSERPSRCFLVAKKMPYSMWKRIKSIPMFGRCVVEKRSDGDVKSYVRAHIYGNMGENVIGLRYASGYTGLEGYYDSILRGQDGKYVCRRLTRGTWIPFEDGSLPDEDSTLVQHRKDGKNIVATIDTRYQDIAETALRRSMNQYGGNAGCAILMEVETGYVLACSSLTRDTSTGELREHSWNNVAVSDRYEPGSTFKTVAMTAMLSDKSISLDTAKRVRAGGVKRYSATSGEINDGHGYATDTATLPGVLARSSNVGMCELAWEYYRDRRGDFKKRIEEVFYFNQLNVDLKAAEPKTYVLDVKPDRDFLNLSYGYSATVTPLQLITFYNALANGGKMVKPLFCREIMYGERSKKLGPVVLKERICSEEVAKQMREMLVGVVEKGTGDNIYNAVYGIGGKTGTSLNIRNRDIKNSSFVGFFPAAKPRYTCMVLVENTSIAGRHAAAPVFKKIADCVVAFDKELGSIRLQDSGRVVRPVATKARRSQLERAYKILGMPFVLTDSTEATEWTVFDNSKESYQYYTLPKGVVPDCSGMTIRDAMSLLHSMGLRVRFTGQGKVVSQMPKARTAVKKGAVITLELKP